MTKLLAVASFIWVALEIGLHIVSGYDGSPASELADVASLASWDFVIGAGSVPVVGGLLETLSKLPLIGGAAEGVLSLDLSVSIPYPNLAGMWPFFTAMLAWDYDILLMGPLWFLKQGLLVLSVAIIVALCWLLIAFLRMIGNFIPFT